MGDEGAPVLEERHGEVAVGSREGGVDVAPAHLGRQLRLEPREVAERLGRGVGASNALKGLADAVVRKLESLARDIGRRDAGNVLGLCTGNPLDEVEAELRGVRDAVGVDDRVDDVKRREFLPEVCGELLLAGFRVAKEGADGLEAVYPPGGFALLVAVRRRAPEPARRAREVALGRIDERLADAVKDARSLLLRLEEALWSGVGGDGVRGLVVLADVVRKADEAHGRVVALERVADLVEEADAEDGGQRTSLDDPAGGLGVVGVVVVGALEAEWVPIGGREVQVVTVGGRQPQGALGLDKADEAGRAHDEASDG